MNREQQQLWDRIMAFSIDEGDEQLTFGKRLARENGWSHAFADRVVDEYKRFMFLAIVAGHPVTPSDEVDQAWHLHLTYTRSYWDSFCGNVLGQPIHHGPTKGGRDEGRKFRDWYQRTRESYKSFFGEQPPSDIWPGPKVRFGHAPYFQRVNTRMNWVVRKPKWRPVNSSRVAAFALPSMLLIGSTILAEGELRLVFGIAAVIMGIVAVCAIFSSIAQRRRSKRGDSDHAMGGFFFMGCGSDGDDTSDGGDSGCGSSGCGSGCGGCGG